jgi:hypothetical protein
MSRRVKIGLGIATAWPVIYGMLFVAAWLYLILSIIAQPGGRVEAPILVNTLFILAAITVAVDCVLVLFYLCHLANNDRIEKEMMTVWTIILLFGSIVAMLVYWYVYIWREEQPPVQSPGS